MLQKFTLPYIPQRVSVHHTKFNSTYNILLMSPEDNFQILPFLHETLLTALMP